jgi:hypothetical protein
LAEEINLLDLTCLRVEITAATIASTAAVVHVPDGERQRGERLEVVPGKVLLAVTEVDRPM